jgi:DNA (cytosine-5)-methyltransferase 1
MTLTYGSLFAGVGGFDMGMEAASYEPVFQVEWDKNCQKILHHHWPTVPKWGDVCDVNGADLPPCDVLIFGSPCQDLSVAGKRAGLQEGDRSSMFFEAVRIIKEMRDATNSIYPRATIWENVPGALSSNKGADFGVVLSSMADIGAITQEYAVLDAQHFGVPQRRRRIFLVSIFDSSASERCPDPLLPLIQGSRGDFAKGRKARKDFARLAEGSIDPSNGEGFRMLAFGYYTNDDTASAIKMRDYKDATDLVVPFVKSRRAQTNTDDETWVEGSVTPTLNAFDNGGETRATVLMPVAYSIREDAKANNFSVTETDTALCLNGLVPSTQSHHAQIFIAEPIVYDGYNQKLDDSGIHRSLRIGRDSSDFVAQPIIFENSYRDGPRVGDDICHTLPAKMGLGGGNTPMLAEPIEHRLAVRRLTPLECERLMGWPDDHTRWTADGKEQADTNRYKQCGNGVASPVARWVGEQLRPVLETE